MVLYPIRAEFEPRTVLCVDDITVSAIMGRVTRARLPEKSIMRAIILVAALTAGLAGCQTVEESAASAEFVCQQSGLRPGTNAYGRCVNASYAQNRQQADQAANAVALGAAAGLIGGAVVASSTYKTAIITDRAIMAGRGIMVGTLLWRRTALWRLPSLLTQIDPL